MTALRKRSSSLRVPSPCLQVWDVHKEFTSALPSVCISFYFSPIENIGVSKKMLPKVPIFMPKPQKPGMGILVSGLCLERQVTSKGMSCPFALSWLILRFLSDMRWAVCFTTWPWPCFVQKRSSQVSTDWNLETVSTWAVCAFLLNGFSQAFWPSDATWGVHSQCAVYDSKSFSHIHNCPNLYHLPDPEAT